MSVPSRAFPAAAMGPSIGGQETAVPPSIIQGINYTRSHPSKAKGLMRNAPDLQMAGQKQLDTAKGSSPYIHKTNKSPTDHQSPPDIENEPHLLITQGRSLQYPRRQMTVDELKLAKSKRFASVSGRPGTHLTQPPKKVSSFPRNERTHRVSKNLRRNWLATSNAPNRPTLSLKKLGSLASLICMIYVSQT